ncbi:MAG: hypothetical protein HY919_02865 [Elusimicrobia bacterium]|nr:hypothetical protein [Elusimicrobiota bacterium]
MIPWTGLGLYNGYRGSRWIQNRIKIFEQFVLPSLLAQTNRDFIVWCAWRYEEKNNKIVQDFRERLNKVKELKFVHSWFGVPFYDDKYSDEEAKLRLINSLHNSMGTLVNAMGECDNVIMTIQPSDDLYFLEAVEGIQRFFKNNLMAQAVGFERGYICNYSTKEMAEYNPKTNPPFVSIKFPRDIFIDPFKHCEFTAIKYDCGKYKKGTPCPSHEYYSAVFHMNYHTFKGRGFCVGVHGENISTSWNIPYKGELVDSETLGQFGIADVLPLKIKFGWKKFYWKLSWKIQRKLRYWFSEKLSGLF